VLKVVTKREVNREWNELLIVAVILFYLLQ
jgi:hypothetical protein